MGSPLTATLCRLAGERIDRSSEAGRRILDWPGNPDGWADGLPLRLCGGLHALVRRGELAALGGFYPPNPTPSDDALWKALAEALHAPKLLPWLDQPPQTNEVGRGNGLMAGLLAVAEAYRLPIRLFELGASAGLNLILDRYRFDLGGTIAGDAASPLRLKPEWTGPPPPPAEVRVAARRGVDIHPLNPVADREKLLAYVWPDQRERLDQTEAALDIAAAEPAPVDQGDAAHWLEAHLDVMPEAGTARVVMHSVAFQYFPSETQRRIERRMAEAGAKARADAPLAWLRFEKEPEDKETSLRLRLWPGEERLLAHCQPHGRAIHWLGG